MPHALGSTDPIVRSDGDPVLMLCSPSQTEGRAPRAASQRRGNARLRGDSARAVYLATHNPQHDKNNQNDPEHTAETRAAVATVRIISPAAAENENQYDNEENRAHVADSELAIMITVGLAFYGFFTASLTASLRPPTAF
jgi:hypothetical protein